MSFCYFDCFAGAAGDMLLGALIDAGADPSVVRDALGSLDIDGWSLSVDEVTRRGFRATKVTVEALEPGVDRRLSDIEALIETGEMDARARGLALQAFRALGQAEARVHGVGMDEVHFHEVGALDAIVDVVGTCVAFVHLGIEQAGAGTIAVGSGTTTSAHGPIPIPAPAVVELLTGAGASFTTGGDTEKLTPTGAALLVTLVDEFGPTAPIRLDATGYGAGLRDTPEMPNVVRVLIGERDEGAGDRRAWVIEANIDDMTPELLAHAAERLLESGAVDVWTTPIVMKKSRSGVTLSVLVDGEHRAQMLDALFTETSTLGVRISEVTKEVLERDFVTVEIDGQPVRVKRAIRRGLVINLAPEYEDARAAATALGRPLKDVYAGAIELARAAE